MSFYLDTNVVVSLFRPDAATAKAVRWLRSVGDPVHISDFGAVEFAAVLSREVRTGDIDANRADAVLAKFDTWRRQGASVIAISAGDMLLAERLVRDFASKLQAPDALHMALAVNAGLTLVTFDLRLADAARLRGTPIVVPS